MVILQRLFFICVNCILSSVYSRHCDITIRVKELRCDYSSRNVHTGRMSIKHNRFTSDEK